jgi:mono/diheme cytochrome c family protein
MRNNIWFPLILVTVLWLVGLGGAYAGVVIHESSKASSSTNTTHVPATTTATLTPTTTTPAVLNGQAIYDTNCLSCHSSRPQANNITQAQLSTFISRHNSGRNLTQEQIAAIVAFLKP